MTPERKRPKRKSNGVAPSGNNTPNPIVKREKRSRETSDSSSASVIVVSGGAAAEPDDESAYMFIGRVLVIRRLFGGLVYDRWYARWRRRYGSWAQVEWECVDTPVEGDEAVEIGKACDVRENIFVHDAIFSPNDSRPTVVRYFLGERFPVVWLNGYVPNQTISKKMKTKLAKAWQGHYASELGDEGGSAAVSKVTDTCFSVMDRELLRTQHIVGRLSRIVPGAKETHLVYLYLDLYDVNTILICQEEEVCQLEDAHVQTMMSLELGQGYILQTNDKEIGIQVLLEHTKDLSWYQSKVETIKALYFHLLEHPNMLQLEQRDFQQALAPTNPRGDDR